MAYVCSKSDEAYNIIVIVLQVPTLLLSLYFPVPMVAAYRKKELKTTKLQFGLALTFLALISLHNISEITQAATQCNAFAVHATFDVLRNTLYIVQGSMLGVLLFLRLVFIFMDTQFEVSKCTMYVFAVLLTIEVLLFAGLIALWFMGAWDLVLSLIFLCFLYYVVGLIAINVLFIRRLLNVYASVKHNTSKESGLKRVATKNAVLAVVSSSTCWLTMIGVFLYVADASIVMGTIYNVFLQIDVMTNLLSIVLTYSHFDAWYQRLCGCCHRRCGECCLGCVQRKVNDQDIIEVEEQTNVEADQTQTSMSPSSPETSSQQQEL